MNNYLPVLIVGAGPTGLMAACELARHGIPFRIIDKKAEPTLASNASWIQTRTIELFDLAGLSDRFLRISHECKAINLYSHGEQLIKIPLNHIDSLYPFVAMLPQSDTENLLIKRLSEFKHQVERPIELIDVRQQDNLVIATIQYPNGRKDEIISQWLIACDGANSSVRNKSKIYFPGEDLTEQFIVADAEIDSLTTKNEIHMFFDLNTVFFAFPLGENRYRISANLNLSYPRKIFSEVEIIELAQERAHGAYYVKKVSWVSPFWIHSKVVANMRDGSVFLAGDAAHIFSPVSGQGMNAGLQDAFNLAWKLALVIQGKAKPSLLDSYQEERHPVISEDVDLNEKYTKIALFDQDSQNKLIQFCQQLVHDTEKLSNQIASTITQLNICYDQSPIVDTANSVKGNAPRPGERAPDVKISKSKRLYDYLRNTLHNILIFVGADENDSSSENTETILQLHHWLAQTYPDLIKVHLIASNDNAETYPDVIVDENNVIHKRYGLTTTGIYVIRPDNYIAYSSTSLELQAVQALFNRYLK